jgi:hypothetical protein
MVDWARTATTIYCDAVEDEVTLIVDKDGTLKCTGYSKYSNPDKETARSIRSRSRHLRKELMCEGLDCHRATQYREKLFAEEA